MLADNTCPVEATQGTGSWPRQAQGVKEGDPGLSAGDLQLAFKEDFKPGGRPKLHSGLRM